jgi:hypothetical protein
VKTKQSITPGPWRTSYSDGDDNGRYVLDSNAVLIADCYADTALDLGLPDRAEYLANAQAIAALPDLIAALRSALGSCAYMLADCADDDSEHFQRLEIEINEAFAKAGIR